MTVKRRHVIYVPGYDPRGVAHYYRMFRSELARFRDLHGLRVTVSRPTESRRDAASTTWSITTDGPDWQVETTYELLRWDDIVRADARRPAWRKIAQALILLVRVLANGTFARMFRAHWRFAAFFAYPYLLLLAFAGAAGVLGWGAASLAALVADQAFVQLPVGLAVGTALLVVAMRVSERHTYLLYLLDDAISTDEFARGMRPDWVARLLEFSQRVVQAAQLAAVDEIVVVGHSSGSFMAVDVLAQALSRDPALGRHGAAVSLVTLGANLPLVGFNPAATWFLDRVARVAGEPALTWLDVQSRKDVMSFYRFDQISGHGLVSARSNLTTVSVRFRDVILPQNYARFRWRFFRVHFQYLMANERVAAYDYFMMICGPRKLAQTASDLSVLLPPTPDAPDRDPTTALPA